MTGFSLISGFEKEIIRQLNKYYGQVSNRVFISYKVYIEYYVRSTISYFKEKKNIK